VGAKKATAVQSDNILGYFTACIFLPIITLVFGRIIKQKNIEKKKLSIVIVIYMVIATIITTLLVGEIEIIVFCVIFNLIALIPGDNNNHYNGRGGTFGGRFGRYSGGRSSSFGGFSGGRSFGGGGYSGGGGSSRKF